MSKQENIKLINQLYEDVLNEDNPEKIEEIIAKDYFERDLMEGQTQGIEGISQRLGILRSAFPDAVYGIVDMVVDIDKVCTKWKMNATHKGKFMNIEPTYRRIELVGMDIYYITDNKIVSHTNIVDMLSLMNQLNNK